MNAKNPEQPLQIFSRVCKVIKCFAKQKGIYYYKLGYLNGVSIMIMVAYVLG
jgi:poly(A) polymerase Pap1